MTGRLCAVRSATPGRTVSALLIGSALLACSNLWLLVPWLPPPSEKARFDGLPDLPVTTTPNAAIRSGTEIQSRTPTALSTANLPPTIPGTCRRKCDDYNNKVVVISGTPPKLIMAGLYDRMKVLFHTINLAGYLCAHVEVLGPHFMLNPIHNRNRLVDPALRWSDFRQFYFKGEIRTPSLVEVPPNGMYPFLYKKFNSTFYYIKDREHMLSTLVKEQPGRDRGGNWYYHRTSHPKDTVEDFKLIESISLGTSKTVKFTNFVWHLDAYPYAWREHLHKFLARRQNNAAAPTSLSSTWNMLPHACNYSGDLTPPHLETIASDIWRHLLLQHGQNSTYGGLHVRRGDIEHKCNTTLERLERFLKCSFQGTESLGPMVLLFQSDERDAAYRRNVGDAVARLGGHVTFVDLDALVQRRLQDGVTHKGEPSWQLDNNFYVFWVTVHVVAYVSSHVTFRLTQKHRSYCPDCSPIAAAMTEQRSSGRFSSLEQYLDFNY